jgi:hypothetical protein
MKTIEKLLILLFFTVPWQFISASPVTWDSYTEQQVLNRLDEINCQGTVKNNKISSFSIVFICLVFLGF